jgi:hypothetical protein
VKVKKSARIVQAGDCRAGLPHAAYKKRPATDLGFTRDQGSSDDNDSGMED